jgi:hypothetical protein
MPSGFSAGLARGLAGTLKTRREQTILREREAAERTFQTQLAMLPVILEKGHASGDYSFLEQWLGEIDPKLAAKFKKEGSGLDVLGPILSQQYKLEQSQGGDAEAAPAGPRGSEAIESAPEAGAAGPGAAAEPEADPGALQRILEAFGVELPGVPTGAEATRTPPFVPEGTAAAQPPGQEASAPMLRGLPFGIPLEEEQKREREAALQKLQVVVDFRRRLLKQQGVDPASAEYKDFVRYGSREPSGVAAQSIAGELPDGTPAFGIFDRINEQYLDPATREPIEGFRPRTTTGSQSLGVYAERAARELGYPTANAAAQAGEMEAVNQRASEIAGEQAGATTTGRGEAAAEVPLSTAQRFQATTDLAAEWTKIEAPRREMERQLLLMNTGLERFREGDKTGGSQAVLVTFQKILDPDSVVRVSEYQRSAEGLSLWQRMEGYRDRLLEGGAGVPEAELALMVGTAQAFVDGMATWNDLERDRIRGTAEEFGIDPERVFGVADAATDVEVGVIDAPIIDLDTPLYLGPDGRYTNTPPPGAP